MNGAPSAGKPRSTAAPPGRQSCTDRTSQSEVFLKDTFYKGFVHLGCLRFRTSRSSVLCSSVIKVPVAPNFPVKRVENDQNASNLFTIHLWSPHFS